MMMNYPLTDELFTKRPYSASSDESYDQPLWLVIRLVDPPSLFSRCVRTKMAANQPSQRSNASSKVVSETNHLGMNSNATIQSLPMFNRDNASIDVAPYSNYIL